MFRHLCLAIAFVVSATAEAQPTPQVEPNVISVQTIGDWASDDSTGRYKVIVTSEGWEHVWSRVYVEWLPDPSSPQAEWKTAGIVELAPPVAPGVMILEATARQHGKNRLVVTVRATPNQGLSEFGVS